MPEDSAIPPRTRTATAQPKTQPPPPTPPREDRPSIRERVANKKRELSKRARVVREFIQLPLIPVAAYAQYQQARNPGQISPYTLDIRTVELHGDDLAEAVADVADAYPVLAAALDRIGTATPFMALAMTAVAIAAQIAENHKKLPENYRSLAPSVIPREDLAEMMMDEAREAMAADDTLTMAGNGYSRSGA